jgi:fumarate hydratase class II
MVSMRQESDSFGVVEVPADKLWGAQTQRCLEHCRRRLISTARRMRGSMAHQGEQRPSDEGQWLAP